MNCNISDDYIYDYLDGELDELTRLIIREHLRECEKCNSKAAEIKQLFYELDKLEKENIDLPIELDSIYDRVYELCNENKTVFTTKDYLNIQKYLVKRYVNIINFIPGTKLGKKAVGTLYKGALKASGLLLKQGYKLAFSGR